MSYQVSDEDKAIWQAAKETQDIRTGKARPGLQSRPKHEPDLFGDPRLKGRYIKKGKVLYYKNLKTGQICQGVVAKVNQKTFVFRFNNRSAVVPLGCVGDRLFYTEAEAQRFGRSKR